MRGLKNRATEVKPGLPLGDRALCFVMNLRSRSIGSYLHRRLCRQHRLGRSGFVVG